MARHGEGAFEDGIKGCQVSSCPAVVTIKVAEHDQLRANIEPVGGDGELPVGIAVDGEKAEDQEQPVPGFHLVILVDSDFGAEA